MNVKIILNKDLSTLGEEGDVKEVARGFARNFLLPRGIAVPYNERTVALFESRRSEIEARKEEKRKAALGLKERLEGTELSITMPAGANGRLYGAVTGHTLVEELVKAGFDIERKRIEIPGNTVKAVGKYKATVHLYGAATAEIAFTVLAQVVESEKPAAKPERRRRYRDEESENSEDTVVADATSVAESAVPDDAVSTETEAAEVDAVAAPVATAPAA